MDFPRRDFSSYSQADVSEANRLVYAGTWLDYDKDIITDDSQTRLRSSIEVAVSFLKRRDYGASQRIRSLDACGGTGNAAFILNDLGCEVKLIDISPEMIEAYRRRCSREGREADSCIVDASSFFCQTTDEWDLIVFSSALHHFREPSKVLLSALSRLSSGGVVLSVADPTPNVRKRWFKALSLLDRILNTLRRSPGGFAEAVGRRLLPCKLWGAAGRGDRNDLASGIGYIAEYQTHTGIDDESLKSKVVSCGFSVLLHRRYSGGFNPTFRFLYRMLRARTSFCMMVTNRSDVGLSHQDGNGGN